MKKKTLYNITYLYNLKLTFSKSLPRNKKQKTLTG